MTTISNLPELTNITDLSKVLVVVEDQETAPQRTKNVKLSTVLSSLQGATGPTGPAGVSPVAWQLTSGTYAISMSPDGRLISSDGIFKINKGLNVDGGTIVYNPITHTFYLGDTTPSTATHFYFFTQDWSSDPLAGFTYAQFHNNSQSNGLVLHRARGDVNTHLPVQPTDTLGRLTFTGHDATTTTLAAQIFAYSVGPSQNGFTPSSLLVKCSTTSSHNLVAAFTSTGSFKTDKFSAITATNNVLVESGMLFSQHTTYRPLAAAPLFPTAGMTAVANGTGWNPTGDGLEHLMIYLNGTWVKVA